MQEINPVKELIDLVFKLESFYITKSNQQTISSLKEKIIGDLKSLETYSEKELDTSYLANMVYKYEGWISAIDFIGKIYPDKLDDFDLPDDFLDEED